MDGERFEEIIKSMVAAEPRRRVLRAGLGSLIASVLVGVGLGAGDGTEAKKSGHGKGRGKRKPKVTICHNGQTITVAKSALKAHLQHGDTLGPCPTVPVQCPATCPECQQCVDGQNCTPASGGICQNNPCRICEAGICSANDGIGCDNNECKECKKGSCVNKTTGAACSGGGKCNSGICTPPPLCSSAGVSCTDATAVLCCSQSCSATVAGQCAPSDEGENCKTDTDCAAGLECSANFTCQFPR